MNCYNNILYAVLGRRKTVSLADVYLRESHFWSIGSMGRGFYFSIGENFRNLYVGEHVFLYTGVKYLSIDSYFQTVRRCLVGKFSFIN